jgi:hypothetical protein
MAYIRSLSVDAWKQAIADSNARAMQKRHQYPPCEGAFLEECCVFAPPSCNASCFCRQVGCNGVWTLRPDLDFGTFLECYAELWVRGSTAFRLAVAGERAATRRTVNGIRVLQGLEESWSDWDGAGHSLPEVVSEVRRSYFCDDAFDLIQPSAKRIQGLAYDSTGIYTAKLISQLFYDIAVPFDTNSRKKQENQRYTPSLYGDGAMRREVREWLVAHRMSVDEFRSLDNAPSEHWLPQRRPDATMGTACSRVLDKLFYGQITS